MPLRLMMYPFLLVAALVAADALASPVRTIAPKRRASDTAFSVQVQRKNLTHIPSGPSVLSKTYRKFHGTFPEREDYGSDIGAAKFQINAAQGTVAADPTSYDQEYLAEVWVGAQKLSLDIDSGSSDLWVYSSELPAIYQEGHDVYNPNRSSTARNLANQSWEIFYGDGSTASGDVWQDCVWVGGTVVERQAIEAADQVSDEFHADVNSDGIMGLGFDVLNSVVPTQQSTFLSNAIQQGLPQPVFTADLKYHASGSYDFGYIDSSKYSGPMTYVPVDSSDGYWRLNTTTFGYRPVNGTAVSYDFIGDSIVDTGTSILFTAPNIALYYWAQVKSSYYDSSSGGYVFACGDADILPDLTLGIQNYTAVIPGKYMAYSPVGTDGSTCFGGVQSDEGLPFQILGDVFLKAVFVAFDAGSPPRLGFADKAP